MELVTFNEYDDNIEWKNFISKYINTAKRFEIHCWNEENEYLEKALKFGTIKNSEWEYGNIVEGDVTDAFIKMILSTPKPTDTELYNKMTPFFNIFLDDNYSSSHYGTEVYIG